MEYRPRGAVLRRDGFCGTPGFGIFLKFLLMHFVCIFSRSVELLNINTKFFPISIKGF